MTLSLHLAKQEKDAVSVLLSTISGQLDPTCNLETSRHMQTSICCCLCLRGSWLVHEERERERGHIRCNMDMAVHATGSM